MPALFAIVVGDPPPPSRITYSSIDRNYEEAPCVALTNKTGPLGELTYEQVRQQIDEQHGIESVNMIRFKVSDDLGRFHARAHR